MLGMWAWLREGSGLSSTYAVSPASTHGRALLQEAACPGPILEGTAVSFRRTAVGQLSV